MQVVVTLHLAGLLMHGHLSQVKIISVEVRYSSHGIIIMESIQRLHLQAINMMSKYCLKLLIKLLLKVNML